MNIEDLKPEDLMQTCPECSGASDTGIDSWCDRCEGTGTVLTPAGEAINKLIRREFKAQAKWERHKKGSE